MTLAHVHYIVHVPIDIKPGYATLILPSSSAANAILSFDQKLRIWRDILTDS